MLLVESVNGSEGNVKMVRATPVSCIRGSQHTIRVTVDWSHVTVCETEVLDESGHFHVLNKSLSLVDRPLPGVKVNLEGVGPLNIDDLDGLAAIDFGLESFDFIEGDIVAFFITVALVFVHHHSCFLLVAHGDNHEGFGCFTVVVEDFVVLAVVNESVAE